jgi:hemerythrin-like domain-containing protein
MSNALRVIHKYIRREMFDLAERMFRAGPEDVPAVTDAFEDMAELLRGHAEKEDEYLVPLLREADPAFSERVSADHHRLEHELEGLMNSVRDLGAKPSQCQERLYMLHLDWNRYLSLYLKHLDDEERLLFAKIEDRLPPIQVIIETARAEDTRQARLLLSRLWSVTTCEERVAIDGPKTQPLAVA